MLSGINDTKREIWEARVGLLVLVLIVILVGAFVWQYYFAKKDDLKKDDLLIYGVPYYGTFTAASVASSRQAIADMILGYWGDTRFSLEDIYLKFTPGSLFSGVVGNPKKETPELSEVISFFNASGYDARLVKLDPTSVDTLEQYIKNDVPIIIPMKFLEGKPMLELYLLIGISYSKQNLVFHVPSFGNNYGVPFSDFTNLLPQNPVLVIIEPQQQTRGEPFFRGPKTTQEPYPTRLGIMNSLSIRNFLIKAKEAQLESVPPGNISLWEEAIRMPGFQEIRPDGKISVYTHIARAYIQSKDLDKAIDLLTTRVMPLNHDLDNGYGEWPPYKPGSWLQGQWALPWSLLGEAYYRKGEFRKAREAFLKALEINPAHRYAKTMLEKLK